MREGCQFFLSKAKNILYVLNVYGFLNFLLNILILLSEDVFLEILKWFLNFDFLLQFLCSFISCLIVLPASALSIVDCCALLHSAQLTTKFMSSAVLNYVCFICFTIEAINQIALLLGGPYYYTFVFYLQKSWNCDQNFSIVHVKSLTNLILIQ